MNTQTPPLTPPIRHDESKHNHSSYTVTNHLLYYLLAMFRIQTAN
jgi:hypothetical protein